MRFWGRGFGREVALRKESVDRNAPQRPSRALARVALRKESVDRNCTLRFLLALRASSLSARRAWIEIVDKIALPDVA